MATNINGKDCENSVPFCLSALAEVGKYDNEAPQTEQPPAELLSLQDGICFT